MGMTSVVLLIHIAVTDSFDFFESLHFPSWLVMNADLIPLFPALFIVGGVIVITLSYVSWRKYRGEKEKTKAREKRDKLVD